MHIGTTTEGEAFRLPAEAVTQTFAFLAKREVGKTYAAGVLAEELLAAGCVIAVLDIMGVWWGLRAEGKRPGFPILIMGGEHQDVPLDPAGGKFVANFLVSERVSTVIDLSELGEGEMRRFGADFLSELYRRNREPLHLVVEEADEFAPQTSYGPEQAKVLGAMQRIVRRGRSRGIGCTLVTQRSAVINKSVLTQTEALAILRTTGPQDQKAIEDWIKYHGTPEERAVIMQSLPQLEVGTCWFYSPGWVRTLQKIHIREKWTFDSSATPKAGQAKSKPKSVAEIDLKKLSGQMTKAVETAKASDPAELKRRVAQLERELRDKARPIPAEKVDTEAIRKEGVRRGYMDACRAIAKQFRGELTDIRKRVDRLADTGGWIVSEAQQLIAVVDKLGQAIMPDIENRSVPASMGKPAPADAKAAGGLKPRAAAASSPAGGGFDGAGLSRCERAVLNVLAQFPDGRSKSAAAIQAGYSQGSGGFNNSLSRLRSRGLISGGGDCLVISEAGLAAAGPVDPLPRGAGLVEFWCRQLGKCEAAIVRALWARGSMSKAELGEATEYSATSGGFNNSLSRLRTLELINRGDPIGLTDVFRE